MDFFKGKKVLVTAGPTWVKIDRVRVITSIFSGETGLRFARYFSELGCNVNLLMGPGRAKFIKEDFENMEIDHFTYFEDLQSLLDQKLDESQYDIIIHSSAVSDYNTIDQHDGKLPSGDDKFNIKLTTTPKLVDGIRVKAPDAFLVKFKLQVGLTKDELLGIAHRSLTHSKAQLIVANDLDYMDGENHVAFVMEENGDYKEAKTKETMCKLLADEILRKSE